MTEWTVRATHLKDVDGHSIEELMRHDDRKHLIG